MNFLYKFITKKFFTIKNANLRQSFLIFDFVRCQFKSKKCFKALKLASISLTSSSLLLNLFYSSKFHFLFFRSTSLSYSLFFNNSISHQTQCYSITPLEINQLPNLKFEGRILIIETEKDDENVAHIFSNISEPLGVDTESRPTLNSNWVIRNMHLNNQNNFITGKKKKISIMQVCNQHVCCIWLIRKFTSFPSSLKNILTNYRLIKVCQGGSYELLSLFEEFGIICFSFIDLHTIAIHLKCSQKSLQALTAIFLKKKLDKKQQLSDWERYPLSDEQIQYAANDAFATREILLKMRSEMNVEKLFCEKLISTRDFVHIPSSFSTDSTVSSSTASTVSSSTASTVSSSTASTVSSSTSSVAFSSSTSSTAFSSSNSIGKKINNEISTLQASKDYLKILSNLCVKEGYFLNLEGLETAKGGYKSVFEIRYGQNRILVKSSNAYISLKDAQNDAAYNALQELRYLNQK